MRFPSEDIAPGTFVRSSFHAKWFGHVHERITSLSTPARKGRFGTPNYVVRCIITHDRYGRPLRKPKRSQTLSTYWLQVLTAEEFLAAVQSSPLT